MTPWENYVDPKTGKHVGYHEWLKSPEADPEQVKEFEAHQASYTNPKDFAHYQDNLFQKNGPGGANWKDYVQQYSGNKDVTDWQQGQRDFVGGNIPQGSEYSWQFGTAPSPQAAPPPGTLGIQNETFDPVVNPNNGFRGQPVEANNHQPGGGTQQRAPLVKQDRTPGGPLEGVAPHGPMPGPIEPRMTYGPNTPTGTPKPNGPLMGLIDSAPDLPGASDTGALSAATTATTPQGYGPGAQPNIPGKSGDQANWPRRPPASPQTPGFKAGPTSNGPMMAGLKAAGMGSSTRPGGLLY